MDQIQPGIKSLSGQSFTGMLGGVAYAINDILGKLGITDFPIEKLMGDVDKAKDLANLYSTYQNTVMINNASSVSIIGILIFFTYKSYETYTRSRNEIKLDLINGVGNGNGNRGITENGTETDREPTI